MHDVLDIIKNVQSLYAVGPTLSILKDFERVVDDLDVYVFENWEEGELLSGPIDSRHFVTCSFMWPADKMPDPAGGKRLLDKGCKVSYKKDELMSPGRSGGSRGLQTRNDQGQDRCTRHLGGRDQDAKGLDRKHEAWPRRNRNAGRTICRFR